MSHIVVLSDNSNLVCVATDANVIMIYVRLGMVMRVLASMASNLSLM
ncbi:hypothetical protein [Candidatus Erwinia haradaeae]|nr:hypothetical protein [Candidatus Erwinia haradaeae]